MRKVIGKLFNLDIELSGEGDNFEERVAVAEKVLAQFPEIYFTDYPDGHHPAFFDKYPGLKPE